MKQTKKNINKLFITVAVITLILGLLTSSFTSEKNIQDKMVEVAPAAQSFTKVASSPATFEAIANTENGLQKIGYVVIDHASAYGGPVTMATGIDLNGKITGTVIAQHKDTPSFMQKVLDRRYLNQFIGKSVSDPLKFNQDINGITGATFSSRGIANAVSQGSHAVAKHQFGMNINDETQSFIFGVKDWTVAILLVMALIGIKYNLQKLRWITLVGGALFLGFIFNIPISLSNIASAMMGYFPAVRENVVWYMLTLGIPLLILLIGKNLYCYWLCPFGAVQEIAAKIGGGKVKCSNKNIEAKARLIKYFLTYIALMGTFLLQTPSFAGYEPFAVLFSQHGRGIQWFILPVVLFASLGIYRFWCRYFCPVGVVNEIICTMSRYIRGFNKGVKPWIKQVFEKRI